MKIVVDTNRIIAALIKDSASRRIIMHLDAELISIDFLHKEIKKHKKLILKKANISEEELDILFWKLVDKMVILDDSIIARSMKEAARIMDKIDADDTPFIAAAMATGASIWSDDNHFQKQNRINIVKTEDLAKLISPL